MHLATMYKIITEFEPEVVIIDPISNFLANSTTSEAAAMLIRLVDFLKSRGVTSLFTNLVHRGELEATEVGISSIIDSWLLLKDTERDGERGNVLYVLKARGMAHSKRVQKLRLTDNGIELGEVVLPTPKQGKT